MVIRKRSSKGHYKTINTIRSLKGTSYIRTATRKAPAGRPHRVVIFRRKKR